MTAALLDRSLPTIGPSSDGARRRRPHLRVLDQAASRRRSRLRAALGSLFVAVLLGFFAVALVHAQLVAGQQHLDDVRTQIRDLEADRAELIQAVEQASAPHVIVQRATELGMVRSETPVYLAAVASPAVSAPAASNQATGPAETAPVLVAGGVGSRSTETIPTSGVPIRVQVAVGMAAGVSGRALSDLPGVQVAVGQAPVPSTATPPPATTPTGASPAASSVTPGSPSLAGLRIEVGPASATEGGVG